MMSRHFALSSEPSGAIAKRLRHAKNQLYIYIYRERERFKIFEEHSRQTFFTASK